MSCTTIWGRFPLRFLTDAPRLVTVLFKRTTTSGRERCPMQPISRKNALFTDSVIRRMTRIAYACGAINLAQGYPDFDPPKAITDRLAEERVKRQAEKVAERAAYAA